MSLDDFELAEEPKGQTIFVVTDVVDRKSNGEPFLSKFKDKSGRFQKQVMLNLERDGFEFQEFVSLPEEDQPIPRSWRLALLMEWASVTKITALMEKRFTCEKILTQANNRKWKIIGPVDTRNEGEDQSQGT